MNSWTLGRISGILIRVHWTFLLLPIYIYFSSVLAGSGVTAAVASVVFVLAIFGCVLLHELGHALAARQFGIPTRDITLLPIGGVASLERMPRNPLQELWIAVAGPLVNVAIASVMLPLYWLLPIGQSAIGVFWLNLALANVALVVFNMIPAFPMDGGRVLRSGLALFMEWGRATSIAVSVGKFAAVGFGLIGLFSGHLMLVLIAMFIYFAAQSELMAVSAMGSGWNPGRDFRSEQSPQTGRRWFTNEDVDDSVDMYEVEDDTVPSSLTASSVAAWLASRKADYCRVIESGREIGIVTKSQLLVALSRGLGNLPIGNLVR